MEGDIVPQLEDIFSSVIADGPAGRQPGMIGAERLLLDQGIEDVAHDDLHAGESGSGVIERINAAADAEGKRDLVLCRGRRNDKRQDQEYGKYKSRKMIRVFHDKLLLFKRIFGGGAPANMLPWRGGNLTIGRKEN